MINIIINWERFGSPRLAEVQKRDNERLQRSMLEWSLAASITCFSAVTIFEQISLECPSDAPNIQTIFEQIPDWMKQQMPKKYSSFDVGSSCITLDNGYCWRKLWNRKLCLHHQNNFRFLLYEEHHLKQGIKTNIIKTTWEQDFNGCICYWPQCYGVIFWLQK